MTGPPLATSSLALFNQPAAAADGLLASFFVCPDKGGKPGVFSTGCVGDLAFTGEGLGTVLLSVGEGLGAVLLAAGEGFGAGFLSTGVG